MLMLFEEISWLLWTHTASAQWSNSHSLSLPPVFLWSSSKHYFWYLILFLCEHHFMSTILIWSLSLDLFMSKKFFQNLSTHHDQRLDLDLAILSFNACCEFTSVHRIACWWILFRFSQVWALTYMSTWHCNYLDSIHPIAVETFYLTPYANPMVALEKKGGWPISVLYIIWEPWMLIPNFVPIHKYSSCWDISQEKWKLWPAGGCKWKVRGSPKTLGYILWEPCVSVQNFIHPVVWTKDRQTLPSLEPLAWLKTIK